MDILDIDSDYDCGDTTNEFSNLPKDEQDEWDEYFDEVLGKEKEGKES